MTYNEFINNIIETRGQWGVDTNLYYESHHIVPRCWGGEPNKSCFHKDKHQNLIWLYPNEHLQAHYLLMTENPGDKKLAIAYFKLKLDGKRDFIEMTEEESNYFKLAQSRPGKENGMFGAKHTDEARLKMSIGQKESWKNKPQIEKDIFAEKRRERNKISKWWTDGINEYFSPECPTGCISGRKPGTSSGGKNSASIKCAVYDTNKNLLEICECINYAGIKYGLKDREAKSHTGWEKGPYKGYYFIKVESEVI